METGPHVESEHTVRLRASLDQAVRLDPSASDADLTDQLRVLEEGKARLAAAQMAITARLAASQEQIQRDAGVRDAKVGLGIGAQVALALRASAFRGREFLQLSKVLPVEMPATYAVLAAGRTTEWRARIAVRETVFLSREDRLRIDEEIAPQLEGWGDRQVEIEVKKRAYRLDPAGFVARAASAAQDRRVTLRPAPDVMSNLNAHLPVAQGVAAYAALSAEADSKIASGDDRTRGQIMADTLVERVTGQTTAEAVPVAVSLVMTDQAMFNAGDHPEEPAHLADFGPIPADLARRLLVAADAEANVWVQRLFIRPETGQLVRMDSTTRVFRGGLRKFLVIRDQFCRNPWCGAVIRHVDHVVDHADGGPTSEHNGEGLCEACNYAKTAPGWRARLISADDEAHTVEITTPTGHSYLSHAPNPPSTGPPDPYLKVDFCFPLAS